eukprot:2039238-Pyramimonas_sp.AAC.1
MIDFIDDQEEGVEVGVFAVEKKSGRQRLIIDARARARWRVARHWGSPQRRRAAGRRRPLRRIYRHPD